MYQESYSNTIHHWKNESDIEKDFLLAANYAISLGITSVQSNDIGNVQTNKMYSIIHNIYSIHLVEYFLGTYL